MNSLQNRSKRGVTHKRYNDAWCIGIVEVLRRKYLRGWQNLVEVCNTSGSELLREAVNCLQSSSIQWECFKAALKFFDTCDSRYVRELAAGEGSNDARRFLRRTFQGASLDILDEHPNLPRHPLDMRSDF